MGDYFKDEANEDFQKAKNKNFLKKFLNFTYHKKRNLLSLDEVRTYIKAKGETYVGLKAVPIEKIIGSEGRYKDFDKDFMPKYNHLKKRWTSVDTAILKNVNLPPIVLYELGGFYFVRDGNHRVSVAKAQGIVEIDAEVVSLESEIELQKDMSISILKNKILSYEKEKFTTEIMFSELPEYRLDLTSVGRYNELFNHIMVHKYFLNQSFDAEITVKMAAISWFHEVYIPIVRLIREKSVLDSFPERTETDLYIWILDHIYYLKEKGEDISYEKAVSDFTQKYGEEFNFVEFIANIFKPKDNP